MDTYKINNFLAENPRVDFPAFRHLSLAEMLVVHQKWIKKIGLESSASGLNLLTTILERCFVIDGVDCADEQFSLLQVFEDVGIMPLTSVYVNWYRFDDIDKLLVNDLGKHFLSIWYPSSDDIEIFDDSFAWIVAVSHDGVIRVWKEEGGEEERAARKKGQPAQCVIF